MVIFENVNSSIEKLKEHSNIFKIPYQDYKCCNEIVQAFVTKSTFRAFRNTHQKPSEVIRNWGDSIFDTFYSNLKLIDNQNHYDNYITSMAENFRKHWNYKQDSKLTYGASLKIVNLLVKNIQMSRNFEIENITCFQHIPWDSYTLRPLKNIINNLTNVDFSINIPISAGMGYVNTPELYSLLLDAIRKLYIKISIQEGKCIPPIYYEFYAYGNN